MRTKMWMILLAGVIVAAAAPAGPAEKVLYQFCSGANCVDGANPTAGLVADASGNLYGTAIGGGAYGGGAVFELMPSNDGWMYNVLYSFCLVPGCADGTTPYAGLIVDSQGNLYGTTEAGGANNCGKYGCGTVFELTPSNGGWTETVLYSFAGGSDGADPGTGLTFDGSGNLYGTTSAGGSNTSCAYLVGCGTVYELTTSNGVWTESVLYAFQGSSPANGVDPSPLVFDSRGNLYGTAAFGGENTSCQYGGCGSVFELTHSNSAWTEDVLYNFCSAPSCADGDFPNGGLIFDNKGNLYGTTVLGGVYGFGTAFELMPANTSWQENIIYNFCSAANCADGSNPDSSLVFDGKGNLYGTTQYGGKSAKSAVQGFGTVFRLSLSGGDWKERVFEFSGKNGDQPNGVLLKQDTLYGTTAVGGKCKPFCEDGGGVIFEITP